MIFADIYSDIETTSNVTGQRAFIKRAVQRTLDRIASFEAWPFYLTFGFFTTTDDYSTGTADVTNGSTTVSGTGTTWTASMVGRKFRIGSSNAYYTIVSRTSNTSITLDQPYQGSTATAQSYSLFQDEYRLGGDVDILHFFRQIENGVSMLDIDPADFDVIYPAPNSLADPRFVMPIGRGFVGMRDGLGVYTTGTISGSSGASIITGASTVWTGVQGLSRGNRIASGSTSYVIRSVDSDTQLTIYGTISPAISAGATYTIPLDNIIVQLYQIPDNARNIYYRYYRKPIPILNDTDEPDLPANYHWLLVRGGLIEAWSHKGDETKSQRAESELSSGLIEMRSHYASYRVYQRFPSFPMRTIPRRPRYPTEYDVSVSR